MQESGTWLRRAAAERPAWQTTWASPNDILADREIGNGIIYRDAQLTILDQAPTRRDDPDDTTRRAARQALRAYVRQCHRAGLPVILAGDSNDGAYASHFEEDLKVAAHHVVDWILVSREIRVHDRSSRSLPVVSDHDAILATISVPVRAPTRLPD